MKKALKAILITTITSLLIVFCLCLWFRHGQFLSSGLSREFYSVLEQSNQEVLDLRKIKAVEWDEFVFWSPYENICSYGIDGFKKNSLSCKDSTDDGECYLLFLKNNKLVGTVPINRKKIDLTKANLKGRVSKEKAVFRFQSKSDWPEVKLVE